MFSSRCDFVRRTMAASANGSTIVRKITVRCGRPYGWNCGGSFMTMDRKFKIQAPTSREIPSLNLQRLAPGIGALSLEFLWSLDVETCSFPLAYHPEIARNNVGNPCDVAGKRLTCLAIFLHRHHEQIRFH